MDCGVKLLNIERIEIVNDGYILCKSNFYTSKDIINREKKYIFSKGVNRLNGEIDSGVWAVSYLLSMFKYRQKDFILYEKPEVFVGGEAISLAEFSEYSCYMDKSYPLFASKKTVRELVSKGIKKTRQNYAPENIKDMFCIDENRFERPLNATGNEVFKAMAAIAYSNNKQVFCFPWLSQKRFEGYHNNLLWLLDELDRLGIIAIVPVGR